ncbi:RDD family protein [Amycolatopsis sp. OK19-0408]|uniref:RDD family protein n=1 Tax=Amycolatopsis iheyensis TaxID=2945988 RepID=A0A9X2NDA8_9PSEU|nr:RDD family protein [Amycolatopsis iheyensis]MCR6484594.1 RDD family protein [Amycolatopsis iheyensis]
MTTTEPRPTTLRRWGARWIDWLLPWLLSSPLWVTAAHLIQAGATEEAASLTRDGALEVVFGKWGRLDDVGLAALSGYWSTIVLVVAATLTTQLLIVAAYEVLFVRWLGRTPGKMAFSLTVIPAGTGGTRLSLGQTVRRTAIAVVLPGAAWVLLVVALLDLSVLWALPGALLLAFSAADCLALRRTEVGRTCWHDRRTGSAVVPVTWVQQLRQARELQQRAVEQGRALALDAWNSAPAQQATAHLLEKGREVRGSSWGQALEGRARRLRARATGDDTAP